MLLTLLLLATPPADAGTPATLLRIIDGDTLAVELADGSEARVRLLYVDTPERTEPGYWAAGAFVERLVPIGSTVTLVNDKIPREDRDRYGRLLRRVGTSAGQDLSRELVCAGLGERVTRFGQPEREDTMRCLDD